MTSTLAPLWASLLASTPPYGLLPMILLSRVTAPVFRLMGGYAMVHFFRSNALFYTSPSSLEGSISRNYSNYGKKGEVARLNPSPQWLPWIGGPIYEGKYQPPSIKVRRDTPTLSEILATQLSSYNILMAGVLMAILMGAGLSGITGCAAAFLFDGEDGRLRYQVVRRAVQAGQGVVLATVTH